MGQVNCCMLDNPLEPATHLPTSAVRYRLGLPWVLLSAVLYSLCFPPFQLRQLAWVALVPLLVVIRQGTLGNALVRGWSWGLVMSYAVGDCLPRAVSNYYDQPAFVGAALSIGVYTLMSAPYYMLFAGWYWAVSRREIRCVSLLAAAAWVAAEFCRARLVSGLPWALFGYSQVGAAEIVQVADITGVYGITFVLVGVNAALAEMWLSWRDRSISRRALLGTGLAVTFVAITLVYGHIRMTAGVSHSGAPVRVAIVQGNLDLGSQWRSELYGRNLGLHLRLTQKALRGKRVKTVFWPESSMTFFLDDEPAYRRAIARVLAPSGAELVAGGPRAVGTRVPVYYNSAFLISPQGNVVARYDKQFLLPFAEHFPFPALDFLRRRFERVRTFTPGAPTQPLPTVAGSAGVVICNEAMFPEIVADRVRAGAGYIVNLSNEAWLGDRKFSEQQFNLVSLRAVEQRRYLVRASTSGPSGIIDPVGRVVARAKPFTRDLIAGTVRSRLAQTWYCRFGDLFAALCALLAGASLLFALGRGAKGWQPARQHVRR